MTAVVSLASVTRSKPVRKRKATYKNPFWNAVAQEAGLSQSGIEAVGRIFDLQHEQFDIKKRMLPVRITLDELAAKCEKSVMTIYQQLRLAEASKVIKVDRECRPHAYEKGEWAKAKLKEIGEERKKAEAEAASQDRLGRSAPSQPQATNNQNPLVSVDAEGTDRIGGAGAERGDASAPSTSPRKPAEGRSTPVPPISPAQAPQRPARGQPYPTDRPLSGIDRRNWNNVYGCPTTGFLSHPLLPDDTAATLRDDSRENYVGVWSSVDHSSGIQQWVSVPKLNNNLPLDDLPHIGDCYECSDGQFLFHHLAMTVCTKHPHLLFHPPVPFD
jgi:hypothetical protein